MSDKVVRLADVTNESRYLSPCDLMDKIVSSGDAKESDKVLVILVKDKDDKIATKYYTSKMNHIEMLAYLMECIRDVQDEMRGEL